LRWKFFLGVVKKIMKPKNDIKLFVSIFSFLTSLTFCKPQVQSNSFHSSSSPLLTTKALSKDEAKRLVSDFYDKNKRQKKKDLWVKKAKWIESIRIIFCAVSDDEGEDAKNHFGLSSS
jgi:hypothetical protein